MGLVCVGWRLGDHHRLHHRLHHRCPRARDNGEKLDTLCLSRQRLSSLILSPENFIVGGSLASKQKARNVEQDRKEFSAHLYIYTCRISPLSYCALSFCWIISHCRVLSRQKCKSFYCDAAAAVVPLEAAWHVRCQQPAWHAGIAGGHFCGRHGSPILTWHLGGQVRSQTGMLVYNIT